MSQSQYTPPPVAPPANRDYNYGASYNQGPPSGGYAPSYDRQGGYGGGNAPPGRYGGAPGGGYQSYPPAESRSKNALSVHEYLNNHIARLLWQAISATATRLCTTASRSAAAEWTRNWNCSIGW